MTLEKRRLIMKTLVFSQFIYCPFAWMCHNRKPNSKLNRLQEKALRFVCNNKCSVFYQLFEEDKSGTINTRNLQYLAAEIFKIKLFKSCDNTTHNLRNGQVPERRHNRITRFFISNAFFRTQPQCCLTFS